MQVSRILINPFTERFHYRIEHLAGKPQGPSLSFASGSPLVLFVFVFGFSWGFCCVVLLSSFFAAAAVSVAEGPSSQKLTR
jgi:hypothetical protein